MPRDWPEGMTLEEALWFSPCPPGFEIGTWREACEEVVLLCGDPIIPLHHERLNRLLRECTRKVQRIPDAR